MVDAAVREGRVALATVLEGLAAHLRSEEEEKESPSEEEFVGAAAKFDKALRKRWEHAPALEHCWRSEISRCPVFLYFPPSYPTFNCLYSSGLLAHSQSFELRVLRRFVSVLLVLSPPALAPVPISPPPPSSPSSTAPHWPGRSAPQRRHQRTNWAAAGRPAIAVNG